MKIVYVYKMEEKRIVLLKEKVLTNIFKLVIVSEPETYISLILDILSVTVKENGMHAIFISYTRPFISLNEEFKKKGLKNIFFIDCITVLGNPGARSSEGVVYIQAPTALEEIAIEVNRRISKHPEKDRLFLIFDSITTAAIFLSEKEIAKLLQTIFVKCAIKGCGCIVLAPKLLEEDAVVKIAMQLGAEII